MKLGIYSSLGLTCLSLGFGLPVLAKACTPAGWCVMEASDNNKFIYKYLKRVGSVVELTLLVVNPEGTRLESSERAMINCDSWQWKDNPQGEWLSIGLKSKGNALALELCSR